MGVALRSFQGGKRRKLGAGAPINAPPHLSSEHGAEFCKSWAYMFQGDRPLLLVA